MIKNTYQMHSEGVLSAYKDNASVIVSSTAGRFFPNPETRQYGAVQEPVHILMKVETHNHPTAIAPFPGPLPVPAARSATKVPPVAAPSPRPASPASPCPTCRSRASNSLGKSPTASRSASSPRWTS